MLSLYTRCRYIGPSFQRLLITRKAIENMLQVIRKKRSKPAKKNSINTRINGALMKLMERKNKRKPMDTY